MGSIELQVILALERRLYMRDRMRRCIGSIPIKGDGILGYIIIIYIMYGEPAGRTRWWRWRRKPMLGVASREPHHEGVKTQDRICANVMATYICGGAQDTEWK